MFVVYVGVNLPTIFFFGNHVAKQSFALDIKAFYQKRRCSPIEKKKKVNTRFAAAICVGRGTSPHPTKIIIDNFTSVKNRDILLTATEHRDTRLKPELFRLKWDVW